MLHSSSFLTLAAALLVASATTFVNAEIDCQAIREDYSYEFSLPDFDPTSRYAAEKCQILGDGSDKAGLECSFKLPTILLVIDTLAMIFVEFVHSFVYFRSICSVIGSKSVPHIILP